MTENTLVVKKEFKSSQPQNSKSEFTKARAAYIDHEHICREWRKAGRPSDPNHPIRKAKLEFQRKLQQTI